MSKGPLEKKLTTLTVALSATLSECQKTDKGNFSASTRLSRSLREADRDMKALRVKVRERRKQIKSEFDKTHAHRRGKNFGGPKKHLFKKRKPSKTKSIKP